MHNRKPGQPGVFFKPDSYPCRTRPVKKNMRVGHRHPGVPEMSRSAVFLSSFAYPKEETRKRHPSQSWPCGLPLLLDEGGTRKNSGFALRQSESSLTSRVFSALVCEARQDKWGRKNSHWHAAEHRRGCRKRDLHCLRRSRVCKAPAASRSTGHPACGGTSAWGPFLWFVSLGKQRNEQTDFS